MTTKMTICLEVDPKGTGVFVPTCPGCWVFGKTRALSHLLRLTYFPTLA